MLTEDPSTGETLIRPFETVHLDGAVLLSQAASWPHRLVDWTMLLGQSRGVVALCGDRVVGTAMVTEFGTDLCALNMIIVEATMRGQGLGRRLMEAVMPQGVTCRLVATQEGLPLYEKLGFHPTGQIVQHQGPLAALPAPRIAVPSRPDDLPQIAALESANFGGNRARLVAWMAENGRFVVTRRAAAVTGYAGLREFGRGHVIGPVVAPDLETAQDLICAAGLGLAGQFLRIDTDAALGLGPWLRRLGLVYAGGGVAMQRGPGDAPTPRYGLFSQALG